MSSRDRGGPVRLARLFDLEKPTEIKWAHGVNSRGKLEEALQNDCHMIEADVSYGPYDEDVEPSISIWNACTTTAAHNNSSAGGSRTPMDLIMAHPAAAARQQFVLSEILRKDDPALHGGGETAEGGDSGVAAAQFLETVGLTAEQIDRFSQWLPASPMGVGTSRSTTRDEHDELLSSSASAGGRGGSRSYQYRPPGFDKVAAGAAGSYQVGGSTSSRSTPSEEQEQGRIMTPTQMQIDDRGRPGGGASKMIPEKKRPPSHNGDHGFWTTFPGPHETNPPRSQGELEIVMHDDAALGADAASTSASLDGAHASTATLPTTPGGGGTTTLAAVLSDEAATPTGESGAEVAEVFEDTTSTPRAENSTSTSSPVLNLAPTTRTSQDASPSKLSTSPWRNKRDNMPPIFTGSGGAGNANNASTTSAPGTTTTVPNAGLFDDSEDEGGGTSRTPLSARALGFDLDSIEHVAKELGNKAVTEAQRVARGAKRVGKDLQMKIGRALGLTISPKGVKFDFKKSECVQAAIDIILETRLFDYVPCLMLNADIFYGPLGAPGMFAPRSIDGGFFVRECARVPTAWLSLGWMTTDYAIRNRHYRTTIIERMRELCESEICSDPVTKEPRSVCESVEHITFAVNAPYVLRSRKNLRGILLDQLPNTSLTVFTGTGSLGITEHTLHRIRTEFDDERLFVDVKTQTWAGLLFGCCFCCNGRLLQKPQPNTAGAARGSGAATTRAAATHLGDREDADHSTMEALRSELYARILRVRSLTNELVNPDDDDDDASDDDEEHAARVSMLGGRGPAPGGGPAAGVRDLFRREDFSSASRGAGTSTNTASATNGAPASSSGRSSSFAAKASNAVGKYLPKVGEHGLQSRDIVKYKSLDDSLLAGSAEPYSKSNGLPLGEAAAGVSSSSTTKAKSTNSINASRKNERDEDQHLDVEDGESEKTTLLVPERLGADPGRPGPPAAPSPGVLPPEAPPDAGAGAKAAREGMHQSAPPPRRDDSPGSPRTEFVRIESTDEEKGNCSDRSMMKRWNKKE
eukprot:CAMPEP_0178988078 /NCGR_PEP_ID=MMETSP0795-20121207/3616_1 /TAXON_ID=88552 /ORGANISM="Amoebophrya sp., Strain Ameob2" /LENGTH=1032 /DNA_ID=CAMNT_0020679323 /DNA_START=517 /DNA_END=3616 /DNA_ORIENTATION=+